METIKKCGFCEKEFKATTVGNIFCCVECKKNNQKRKVRERERVRRNEEFQGVEGVDFLVCQYCGSKVKQISQGHLDSCNPGKTKADYKKEFNLVSTFCSGSSKNFGVHMKNEHYKELFSEKIKGDKNPNSKFKTTQEERNSRSPFSKKFKKYDILSESEKENAVSVFAKDALKDRVSDTTLDYWLNKGLTEDEAKAALKERQTTFSLEKCILKYGKEEGQKKFQDRQDKWIAKIFDKHGTIAQGLSKISNEFIFKLLTQLTDEQKSKCKYGKNEKCIKDSATKKAYKFDFVLDKKIIEFNGDFWHANPSKYKEDSELNFPGRGKILAKTIWEYDLTKNNLAESYNYKILIIWEKDYVENPDREIKKCLEFLNEDN